MVIEFSDPRKAKKLVVTPPGTERIPFTAVHEASGMEAVVNPGTSTRHKARMAALKEPDPERRAALLAEADKLSRTWEGFEDGNKELKSAASAGGTETVQYKGKSSAERKRSHRDKLKKARQAKEDWEKSVPPWVPEGD